MTEREAERIITNRQQRKRERHKAHETMEFICAVVLLVAFVQTKYHIL